MKKVDLMKKLSDLTKIPADKLTEIVTSEVEEVEVELAELHVYTDEELESLKINMNKETTKTAIEMAVKEQRNYLKETFGNDFDFQGKTMANLVETAIKVGEKKAGVKPNEQLQEKDKIINQLRENIQTLETEKNQVVDEKNRFLMDYEINSTITKAIPTDLETIWTSDEISELFKKNYQVVVEEGVKVVKKNGETLRDKKTQSPLPVEAVVSTWLLEKGVTKKTAQGRGEGDGKGKGDARSEFKSVADIVTYAEEKGLSNEQQVELTRKFYKDNPNSGM
jgi:hypothetical protein